MYKLGGAVQAVIPEFPSPEIGHETARNLQRTMQDRVVAANRMQGRGAWLVQQLRL